MYDDPADLTFERFMTLFVGNPTAFGSEAGGVLRGKDMPQAFQDHLYGTEPCGVYPMVHDPDTDTWLVKWGCVDFDIHSPTKRRWDYETFNDAWDASSNLMLTLETLGIAAWREITKSGGIHVWVFAHEWTLAATMRRALLVACTVADVPPTEVNPKSEGFADSASIGNYVRLPYKAWLANSIDRPMVDETGDPIPWPEFVDTAWDQRASESALAEAAALWSAPPPPPAFQPTAERRVHEQIGTMSKRLRAVVENGPLRPGEDRSGWLYYVARLCADDGLTMTEAFDIVALCDELHTHKFTSRNDGDLRIARTVEKAYS